MTLLAEIQAKCTAEMLANRDDGAIAALVSVGRTKPSGKEIGSGTILETIGLTSGNLFLDVIDTAPDFRYVKKLVQDGRLIISSPLVMGTISSMVPVVLTQPQADALLALAVIPDPVSATQIAQALEGL
jgi:urease gamma subunit